ncbi:unnamed protein product [Knipowitschia caucasica]
MGPKKVPKPAEAEITPDGDSEGGGAAGREPAKAEILMGADVETLVCMLQKCRKFQSDLSKRWNEETQKQEERWQEMEVQVHRLRKGLTEVARRSPQHPHVQRPEESEPQSPTLREHLGRGWVQSVIPRLEVSDDIEPYLTTFERLATAYQWPVVEWAVRLVPYLTGRARAAYVAMDCEESCIYKKVKEAILMKYEINEDVYRQRFREPDLQAGETPRVL